MQPITLLVFYATSALLVSVIKCLPQDFSFLPVDLATCEQCCDQIGGLLGNILTETGLDIPGNCKIGCLIQQNEAFQTVCDTLLTADQKFSCQRGADLLLMGMTFVVSGGVFGTCDSVGGLQISSDLDLTLPATTLDASDCNSCCASSQDFDTEFQNAWSVVECESSCLNLDPCFASDTSDDPFERLGCAIGFDLRASNNINLGFDGSSTQVVCIDGDIVEASTVDDEGFEWENWMTYAAAGVGGFFIILLLFMLISTKSRRRKKEERKFSLDIKEVEKNEDNIAPNMFESAHYRRAFTKNHGNNKSPSVASDGEYQQKLKKLDQMSSNISAGPLKLHDIQRYKMGFNNMRSTRKIGKQLTEIARRIGGTKKRAPKQNPISVAQILNTSMAMTVGSRDRERGNSMESFNMIHTSSDNLNDFERDNDNDINEQAVSSSLLERMKEQMQEDALSKDNVGSQDL